MNSKKQILYIDRIEGESAVAFTKSGIKYSFNCGNISLKDGDVIEVTIDNSENISTVKVLPSEAKSIKSRFRVRLKNLFKKSGDEQ